MTDSERLALVRKALQIDDPIENRLLWLRALISDVRADGWSFRTDDIDAAEEALRESERLLNGLSAAFQDEIDARLRAEMERVQDRTPCDVWGNENPF